MENTRDFINPEHLPVQGPADLAGPFIVSDEPADLGDADLPVENLPSLVVGAEGFGAGDEGWRGQGR